MNSNSYCPGCGAVSGRGTAYCPQCGVDLEEPFSFTYKTRRHAHCVACGVPMQSKGAYCPQCGQECEECDLAAKLVGPVPFRMAELKTLTFWVPYLIYAGVAVGVGLLISLVISEVQKSNLAYLDGLLDSASNLELDDFSVGAVMSWLSSCLSGLVVKTSGTGGGEWVNMKMVLHSGSLVMLVVPIAALMVAGAVQETYMKTRSQNGASPFHNAVIGSFLFMVANVILSLLPTPLEKTLNGVGGLSQFLEDGTVKMDMGVAVWNLAFFSFLLSFVVGLPRRMAWSRLVEENSGEWVDSIKVSIQLVKNYLVAGGLVAATLCAYTYFAVVRKVWDVMGEEIFGVDVLPKDMVTLPGLISLFCDVSVWSMTFLTGGLLGLKVGQNGDEFFPFGDIVIDFGLNGGVASNGGFILLLVVGFLMAVCVFHQFVKRDDRMWVRGAYIVAFTTIFMSALSAMANILFEINVRSSDGNMGTRVRLGTFGMENALWVLGVMAAALVVVWFSWRNQGVQNVLERLASLPMYAMYALAIVATLILCVGIKEQFSLGNILGGMGMGGISDFLEDWF